MAASKELITKIVLKGNVDASLTKAFQNLSKNADSACHKLAKIGEKAKTAFKVAAGAVAAGATACAKAAIDYESAFAGVRKTVDETDTTSYEKLSEGIRQLAKETPAAATEIANVAAAAGQLGIKADDILTFSKTMIDLGESTNLTSEEAATSIAKLFNVTGTSMDMVDKFGATLVALGNNAATTESDILAMASRIAGSGTQVGLTEQQILALATSLSSVGIEAEAGGTAISTTMSQIDKDVALQTENLAIWAETAGMSTSQFAKAWKTDAYGALQKVINGMASTKDEGGNLNILLEELGINGIRQGDSLKRLANASKLLANMTNLANEAWAEGTALQTEANTRYATTAARLEILKNQIIDAAITVGNQMLPAINALIDKLGEVDWAAIGDKIAATVQWIIDNFDKLKVAIGILAAAFVAFKVGSFIITISKAYKEIKTMITVCGNAGNSIINFARKIQYFHNGLGAGYIKSFVKAIGEIPVVEKVATAVQKVYNKSIEGLKLSVAKAKLALTGFIAKIKETTVVQSLVAIFNKVKAAMSGMTISTIAQTVAQWAANVAMYACPLVWIVAAILAVIAVIVLLVKHWDKVKEAGTKSWEAIKNAVAKVGEWLKNFFTVTLPNAFTKVITFFKELPMKIWNCLVGVGQKIGEWGANLWEKAKEIGSNFVNSVVNFFKDLPYKIGYALGYALGTVVKFGISLWNWASTEIPKFIGKIVDWFKQLPSKIWTWLVNVVTKVGQWGVNLYNKMKTAVVNAINATVNFFKTLPSKIWTWLVNAANKIGQWGVNIYNKMKNAVSKAINAVVNFFKTLPTKIWTWLQNTIAKVAQWAIQLPAKMKAAAVNAINAVVNFFKTLPTKIWTWLVNTVQKVVSWGSQMVAKAKQFAKSTVDAVVNFFKTLPQKMLDIGKNIVQGLWNGIKNAKDWLLDKVKSFCKGLGDGFKKALGINSPSKITTGFGEFFGQGLGVGIENMKGFVGKSVERLRDVATAGIGKIAPVISPVVESVKGKIQAFANGGTVTRPQAAIVGDAPETIVPHGNTPRNRALLNEAAAGVGASVGGNYTFQVTFAPVINGGNAEENRKMLLEEEEEFERKMDAYFEKKVRLAF